MKLTSEEARDIVESYRGKTLNDKWIDHCICVGDTAGKIAKGLKGYFDNLLGYSLYDLFPEIKDNL